MAVNFRMNTRRKDHNRMVIRISGDFDGNSAWELVNMLFEQSGKYDVVELDTHGLKRLLPFGKNILLAQAAPLRKSKTPYVVSGPYAEVLTGSGLFRPEKVDE